MPPMLLVVEDNPNIRKLLALRLSRYGYQLTSAENGEHALTLLQELTPDLIIVDLALPDITGFELTKRLKSNLQTKDIPIIALTAHALIGVRELALEAGCAAFETKPIDFPKLCQTIDSLCTAHPSPSR